MNLWEGHQRVLTTRGLRKRAELPPAKTTAQEVFGKMWIQLLHLHCQKRTQDIIAVNLCHSQNRTLDAIAAVTARINSAASVTFCSLLIWCLGELILLANISHVPILQLLGSRTIFGLYPEGMVSDLLSHPSPLPHSKEEGSYSCSQIWECLALLTGFTRIDYI